MSSSRAGTRGAVFSWRATVRSVSGRAQLPMLRSRRQSPTLSSIAATSSASSAEMRSRSAESGTRPPSQRTHIPSVPPRRGTAGFCDPLLSGCRRLTRTVEGVYAGLPPTQRGEACVITSNYGELRAVLARLLETRSHSTSEKPCHLFIILLVRKNREILKHQHQLDIPKRR